MWLLFFDDALADKIKATSKERKNLLAEQKELPFWNVPKKKELSGYLKRYAQLVSGGASGAILN